MQVFGDSPGLGDVLACPVAACSEPAVVLPATTLVVYHVTRATELWTAVPFLLSLVLTWNEYFFAALLTASDAKTLPVMVASQTGSQGINWWSMAALSTTAIAPLAIIGIFLERYIVKGLTAGSIK